MKFYTLQEVADMLRVTPKTISKLIKSGNLEATQIVRKYIISEEQLNKFLKK